MILVAAVVTLVVVVSETALWLSRARVERAETGTELMIAGGAGT